MQAIFLKLIKKNFTTLLLGNWQSHTTDLLMKVQPYIVCQANLQLRQNLQISLNGFNQRF